jgi:hypothetical protein
VSLWWCRPRLRPCVRPDGGLVYKRELTRACVCVRQSGSTPAGCICGGKKSAKKTRDALRTKPAPRDVAALLTHVRLVRYVGALCGTLGVACLADVALLRAEQLASNGMQLDEQARLLHAMR